MMTANNPDQYNTITPSVLVDSHLPSLLVDSHLLTDEERQPCEVWTRVMGYHRPVASFNIGKKGEHYERKFFREASARLRD
ncbi:MAG TPA: anaerobic ribonucleoside-triphosphate reductase [Acidiferrobacterales bacterium]|nr:anaerobic ribonucleoside-triphosphate reductase [Acidiferrobacterales bacterium]